jgi:hypothetical protein
MLIFNAAYGDCSVHWIRRGVAVDMLRRRILECTINVTCSYAYDQGVLAWKTIRYDMNRSGTSRETSSTRGNMGA